MKEDCPVCAADYAACIGKADDAENNDAGNGDAENNGQENTDGSADGTTDGQKCVCETVCTEGDVNADCPVCAEDYAACAKNAGGGVNPSEGAAVLENVAIEEAGIAVLAEGVVRDYIVGSIINVADSAYYHLVLDGGKKEARVSGARNDSLVDLIIPSTVTDVDGVEWSIKEVSFTECENLRSVTISEGITTIGWLGFDGCVSLASVSIPSTVTIIEDKAFCECSKLKEIELPDSVTEIRNSVLQYCDILETVKLPSHLTSIGDLAFLWDEKLKNIELPDSVTSIGERAFTGCTSIKYVNIKNVKTMGNNAFAACTSMNNISIPNQLESMGEYAFVNCSSWTVDAKGNKNIVIPRSLEKINAHTFENCSGLTEMTIPDSVAGIETAHLKIVKVYRL